MIDIKHVRPAQWVVIDWSTLLLTDLEATVEGIKTYAADNACCILFYIRGQVSVIDETTSTKEWIDWATQCQPAWTPLDDAREC